MPYVYSTLSNDQEYTLWQTAPEKDRPHVALKSVLIKGGHGIMDRKLLITPLGVVTEVTDEDLSMLEKLSVFKRHVQNGFIVVDKKKSDPEKIASTMAAKDKSAQKTPADFKNPPKVGKPDEKDG